MGSGSEWSPPVLLPTAASSDTAKWECQCDGEQWVQYDPLISAQLEVAFGLGDARAETVSFDIKKQHYSADVKGMLQTNTNTRVARRMRRVVGATKAAPADGGSSADASADECGPTESFPAGPPPRAAALGRQTSESGFECAPVVLAGGALLYSVTAAAVARAADNRDTSEFSLACGHFARLTRKPASSVTRVDVYVNPPLEERFRQMKDHLRQRKRSSGATWVFHGSAEESIRKIMVEGFRVGGKHGHPVANASKYGRGVYTAVGARTALAYSEHGGCKQVILAKGLEGASGDCLDDVSKEDGLAVDSWRPEGKEDDWIVFADGLLLLPRYVVHYSSTA